MDKLKQRITNELYNLFGDDEKDFGICFMENDKKINIIEIYFRGETMPWAFEVNYEDFYKIWALQLPGIKIWMEWVKNIQAIDKPENSFPDPKAKK